MSKFAVPVMTLNTIDPHPNADRLDLAVVGGFRAVVAKGSFSPGDSVVYCPTDSVIPAAMADSLGIADYLAGKNKDRVKAIRLRGILSEGIVLPAEKVAAYLAANGDVAPLGDGDDLAERLGVTKYEEPIPINMAGKARPWPEFLPKYDIENIKRPEFHGVFQPGEDVVVTEKRHGTNCAIAIGPGLGDGERAFVCSRGTALVEDPENLYWLAVTQGDLITKLENLVRSLTGVGEDVHHISLHGEILGCQDLRYGASMDRPRFEAFDLRVNGEWMRWDRFLETMQAHEIPVVPVLYLGKFDYSLIEELAEGRATGSEEHIREGVVIRSTAERVDPLIGRAQLKLISGSYLTRNEATELH